MVLTTHVANAVFLILLQIAGILMVVTTVTTDSRRRVILQIAGIFMVFTTIPHALTHSGPANSRYFNGVYNKQYLCVEQLFTCK